MESTNSSFSKTNLETIFPKRMFNHPFYRAWEMGELSRVVLKTYSKQYYHHVSVFPRYVRATHWCCPDISSRQVLLENLIDKERGVKNHPALWRQFVAGMGAAEMEAESETLRPETKNLSETFMRLSQSSYAEGLGALFAYEQQIPAVATTKADGWRKFYDAGDARTTAYFTLHAEIEVHHSAATRNLIDALRESVRAKALQAAEEVSVALWSFLDGVEQERLSVH